jgi:hypothetical protein
MKRAVLIVPLAALFAVVVWPSARGEIARSSLCDLMTPARMLEHPDLAHQYAQALRSGEPGELARVEALLRDIRAAHGCEGEIALPAAPRSAPALPPGHPPVDEWHRAAPSPLIEPPAVLTI